MKSKSYWPKSWNFNFRVPIWGKQERVKVKTDVQDINNIEITEGLKEGDEVISAPYNIISKTLKDGMKVQVVPKDKLFETKKS